MKKILIFLFFSVFACGAGLKLDSIESLMAQKIQKAREIMASNASTEQKQDSVYELFGHIFDYERMAKIALGTASFEALSKAEQDEYVATFSQMLKNVYVSRLASYKGESAGVDGFSQPNPKRYWLKAYLINDGKRIDFTYKFYQTPNEWLVYDVDIMGVSVMQTYKGQFGHIMQNGGFKALLKELGLNK